MFHPTHSSSSNHYLDVLGESGWAYPAQNVQSEFHCRLLDFQLYICIRFHMTRSYMSCFSSSFTLQLLTCQRQFVRTVSLSLVNFFAEVWTVFTWNFADHANYCIFWPKGFTNVSHSQNMQEKPVLVSKPRPPCSSHTLSAFAIGVAWKPKCTGAAKRTICAGRDRNS